MDLLRILQIKFYFWLIWILRVFALYCGSCQVSNAILFSKDKPAKTFVFVSKSHLAGEKIFGGTLSECRGLVGIFIGTIPKNWVAWFQCSTWISLKNLSICQIPSSSLSLSVFSKNWYWISLSLSLSLSPLFPSTYHYTTIPRISTSRTSVPMHAMALHRD